MKRIGTTLIYRINGAKFEHSYNHPADALNRCLCLMRNGIAVAVKHFEPRRHFYAQVKVTGPAGTVVQFAK